MHNNKFGQYNYWKEIGQFNVHTDSRKEYNSEVVTLYNYSTKKQK